VAIHPACLSDEAGRFDSGAPDRRQEKDDRPPSRAFRPRRPRRRPAVAGVRGLSLLPRPGYGRSWQNQLSSILSRREWDDMRVRVAGGRAVHLGEAGNDKGTRSHGEGDVESDFGEGLVVMPAVAAAGGAAVAEHAGSGRGVDGEKGRGRPGPRR
jgi:hypothetical protein